MAISAHTDTVQQWTIPPAPRNADDPSFALWTNAVTRALQELPSFTLFYGDPNASLVTAVRGTLGFQNSSSATSNIWIKQEHSRATGWTPLA